MYVKFILIIDWMSVILKEYLGTNKHFWWLCSSPCSFLFLYGLIIATSTLFFSLAKYMKKHEDGKSQFMLWYYINFYQT